MNIEIKPSSASSIAADWLVLFLAEGDWSPQISAWDERLGGKLSRLRELGDLPEKLAGLATLHIDVDGLPPRLMIAGLGEPDQLTVSGFEKAAMTSARKLSEKQNVSVAWDVPAGDFAAVSDTQVLETLATAVHVGSVGQGIYQSEPSRHLFAAVQFLLPGDASPDMEAAVEKGAILGEAINLVRELVNRPAQDIYPESFCQRVEAVAGQCGLECEILDEQRLQEERMGSLLSVARGSDRPPRVAILKHLAGGADGPTLALVGKGVTFDSGGLSLKTSEGMKEMKCDMAGAATVVGAMQAIARLNLPVNVIGLAGLVENMVSGDSYKLGDVLTARNGTTIEVLNTDAEGRLVLADVLTYAVDFGADRLVDLATLTGACVVALGEEVTGAFSNDALWQERVLDAAETCGELVWAMPMFDHFAELLKSEVADTTNVGPRWGGAITAAKFLEKFVSDTPWVHLDIAGAAFAAKSQPHREGGASGCMVRTLVELAATGDA